MERVNALPISNQEAETLKRKQAEPGHSRFTVSRCTVPTHARYGEDFSPSALIEAWRDGSDGLFSNATWYVETNPSQFLFQCSLIWLT